MLSSIWLFLAILSYATVRTQTDETLNTKSQQVPALFLSNNISLSVITAAAKVPAVNLMPTSVTTTTNIAQKVPLLRRNASENSVPTPASIFLANQQNQHNVLQLVRNIDARLRNIRNVEMRVATIQEIFDSMHFTSSSASSSNSINQNHSDALQNSANAMLAQDLQIFSKRLMKKLEKATHVVLELRDFFSTNITQILQQRRSNAGDYNDEDEEESDRDFDTDDLDGSGKELPEQTIDLYLSTFIQSCQNSEEYIVAPEPQNYNKQQIQILNYLKTDHTMQQFNDQHFLNENNARASLQANAEIVEKIQNLKTKLTTTNDVFELPTSVRNAPANAKLKFLGNHFKHIYFLSRSDHASDQSERYYYDTNFRRLYVAAIKQKFVFLLIDVGSAMNAELLELTKTFVHNLLQLLSDSDSIAVVAVADVAQFMFLDAYAGDGVYPATRERKEEILHFVQNLNVAKSLTNHTLAFEYAFRKLHMLQNFSLISAENPIEFVYITRGLLNNLSDAIHVLNVVAKGQQSLSRPIVIHTCAVVLDEKRIMYEKQFLSDIASQNYTKYDIKVSNWYNPVEHNSLAGEFFVLTKMHPDTLMRASTAIFKNTFDERYLTQSLEAHAPVIEANDAIVSITHAVPPYGVVGVNLYLADLIEDVINYQQQQHANKNDFSYAFIIDHSGLTIAHPAFPRPFTQRQTPFPVDIGFLENSTDFTNIRRHMLQQESGNMSTTVLLAINRKTELMQRSYHWQSVLGFYVICLVSTYQKDAYNNTPTNATENKPLSLQMPTNMPITLQRFTIKDNMAQYQPNEYEYLSAVDLLYHRLDLIPPTNTPVCRYFRQIATFDAATLFLSASAFESPFTFLHNNRISSEYTQIRTVESIMAYIKDATGLLANPGLRPQIRHEVNALYNAMQHLKKRHQDARGALKNYIIRRYIATVNGVLQVYPGCLLSTDYDATRRPWFRKAMQQQGKIVTTEPYLDAGGAGYIVTIAHTIFEGKANALHSSERDQPVAIVALDLPYAYYYKMILDTTPLCQLSNIKCLLFENEGYLIAHASMLEASTAQKNLRRPYEHLTHKESYLANDILNHKTLVRKLACANYQNRTLQRHYVFNTSLTDILGNVVHGERTKYAIALVRGSNIFAAVLNSTCDGGAFCPCSTIDRICLNCNRMDQTDCECPCECPMEIDVLGDGAMSHDADSDYVDEPFSNYTHQYAYCEPPSEHFIALPPHDESTTLLHSCLLINCDVYGTHYECLGVMGCQWCMQDLDGNGFSAAFCTAEASCFNGVLSAPTPYGNLDDVDIIVAHGYNPGQKPNNYSAFGPIGGAIVVLAIVIGFAIYCYRHNLDTHAQDQFYMDSMQEENYGLPLSRFNFDDCQAHDEPPGSAYDHPSAQRNLRNPADISPYHMSTGSSYRRPANESDHGYSTMTPHEDSSDHQCFTLAEPLLLNDKRHSKSDTLSISTSISSPTNRHQQQQQQQYHTPYASSAKDARYNLTSPKKMHQHHQPQYHGTRSPSRVYEQTTIPLNDSNESGEPPLSPRYILAPVTVHRHMETSES